MIGSAARVMLHEFIADHREDIIHRCRAKVAVRLVPPATEAEIDRGVPLFLEHLVDGVRLGRPSERALHGFTVSQVAHDYGEVCQSIAELAVEVGALISIDDVRTLNGCLDNAIAAVAGGGELRPSPLEVGVLRDNERLGFFVHELRNFIQTAMVAFEVVKSENGGVGGSTGTLLHRSLVGARDLIARSLAEIRLTQGGRNRERFLVSAFIEELVPAAELTANAKGLTFAVMPVNDGLAIEADRHVLAAVVINVLQNAFKFTRPGTTVTLRVGANADCISIEVQDECGGLPGGDVSGVFRPFEQRGADRTGFGLGLAFSRWATEAINGRIHARNLPGVGCVFTVDLPRSHVPALAFSTK